MKVNLLAEWEEEEESMPRSSGVVVAIISSVTSIVIAAFGLLQSSEAKDTASRAPTVATVRQTVTDQVKEVLPGQLEEKKVATESKVSDEFLRQVPVGTIVASVLKATEFSKAVGDDGTFNPQTTKWVPADGRNVAGSRYTKVLLGVYSAPDLRGMFLRGLNWVEDERQGPDKRADGKEDPNGTNRKAGDFQEDTVSDHSHKVFLQPNSTPGDKETAMAASSDSVVKEGDRGHSGESWRYGSEETRPKNSAVFYYIKIN